MQRIIHFWIITLLIFVLPATAQTTSLSTDINQFVQATLKSTKVKTATAIVVVKNDQVIYQNAFGLADVEKNQPATNDTLFYIASITKPMFALTLLHTIEHSEYTVDYTLADMFPEVSFDKSIDPKKITIANLLSHTSGLDDNYLATAVSTSGIHTPRLKMAMLAELKQNENHTQGKFDYTNLGYNILSIWYEKTFGESWQIAMQNIVFSPLKMAHTTALSSQAKQQNWQVAQPYSYFSENADQALYLHKQDNTMHAAGGVLSTTTDMANFLRLQLNQGHLATSEIFSANLIASSQTDFANVDSKRGDFLRTGYTLGWYTGQYKHQKTFHHFGAFDGFRPHFSFMPAQKVGVVILNNEGLLNDKLTDIIADFIYSKLLNEQNIEARLEQRVEKLAKMAIQYRDKTIKKDLSYQSMPLSLSLAKNKYLGTYTHPLAGDMSITLNDQLFNINWGNLQATATAFKKPDTLRVKLRPTSARVVKFTTEKSNVTALTYGGITFNKLEKAK